MQACTLQNWLFMLRTWTRSVLALVMALLLAGAAHAAPRMAFGVTRSPSSIVGKVKLGASKLRVGLVALALTLPIGMTAYAHDLPAQQPGTLGYLSSSYEGQSAAKVNREPVKHRGWDYGVFQLNSAAGAVQQFIKTSRWRSEFDHLTGGTAAFNAKWKEIAAAHPDEFLAEQQAFVQNEMFSPVEQQLKDKYHLDIEQHSVGLQECIWSLSVSFGPALANKAIASAGIQGLANKSDVEIITAVMNEKRHVEKYYPNSPALWDSLRARVDREKAVLLGLDEVKRDITPKHSS